MSTWWVAVSDARAARWARRLAMDARRRVAPAPYHPTPAQWPDNTITLSWLGHSTVLVNFFGFKILTDPVLGSRVGISFGLGTAGPKRYVASALRPSQLPPIDLVLLSHAHMDHMDLGSLRRLGSKVPIVTAKVTADLLGRRRGNVTELGWGGQTTVRSGKGDVEVRAFQVRHWGQRWPSELDRGYNGYIVRREGRAILFGGDTALISTFAELRARGPFEVAIMPIGAYRPWIWNHCSPEQALAMANAARARYIVPVHHQTFKLSDEPFGEPIERLAAALDGEPERLALRDIGQTFTWRG